jgi:thiamine-monophosphate kinase
MPSEFALINTHFHRPTRQTQVGIGDDGAILTPSPGKELVVSTDMLVAGTHFFPDTDPADLGWKALAVNLSDLAAMGAEPRWAFLALALPEANEAWIKRFSRGFFDCADRHQVDLAGGDTTRGPMNFCITVMGEVPVGTALRRSGARPGDELWVSGRPGRAALGLAQLQGRCHLPATLLKECLGTLHRPQPRIALGLALRGMASAAIDISDGLLADLGHILAASGTGAELQFEHLAATAPADWPDTQLARDCQLAGGDDFELAFTAAPEHHERLTALSTELSLVLTHIGSITNEAEGTLRLLDRAGHPMRVDRRGYDHFG